MPARLRGDEGANAVEFALLLPILLMLVFGTMFGASLFNSQQTVTHAAREGARFGAIFPLEECGSATPPSIVPPCWFDEIHDRVDRILDPDRPLTRPGPVVVCVRFYDLDDDDHSAPGLDPSCPAPTSAGSKQGARVEVVVIRPATLELGIAAIGPIDLTGSVVARYEVDMDP